MRLVSIYKCGDHLLFSVQKKQDSGFVMSTMEMLTVDVVKQIEEIQDGLIKSLELSEKNEEGEEYTTSKFNKKLSKLLRCDNYKEVVSKSSIVGFVHKNNNVTSVPKRRASSFTGFEGFKGIVEILPESSINDGEAISMLFTLFADMESSESLCP